MALRGDRGGLGHHFDHLGLFVGWRGGNAESEPGSSAGGVVDGDGAVVGIGDLLDDGEAEAGAGGASGRGSAVEAIEDVGEVLLAEARSSFPGSLR